MGYRALFAVLAFFLLSTLAVDIPAGLHIPAGLAGLLADPPNNHAFSRFIVYLDQWYPYTPPRNLTIHITHVITAFASSALFADDSSDGYEPFISVDEVRARFSPNVNACMSIGGLGDTDGFVKGAATNSSRELFARNVGKTVERLDYDCVDINWQYPGANDIDRFLPLLAHIKHEIGDRELSIAVPGRERDMVAYTPFSIKEIDNIVDYINVMAYDLMDHRDSSTAHHTSLVGAHASVLSYIRRGMTPIKINLGLAYHAKWFVTAPRQTCQRKDGVGYFSTKFVVCRIAPQVHPDGSKTGMSGVMAFDASTFAPVQSLIQSPNGTCGIGTMFKCPGNSCCDQHGIWQVCSPLIPSTGVSNTYSGRIASQCGVGCQAGFGHCSGRSARDSFMKALANKHYDWHPGAKWFWDPDGGIFWTWDTAFNMRRKFKRIVLPEGLGGVFISSIGQDSHDWHRLKRLQQKADKYFKDD